MKTELKELDGVLLDYYFLLSLDFINFPEDSIECGEYFYIDKSKAPFCHKMSIFSFNSLSLPVASKVLKDKGYSIAKVNDRKMWTVWDDALPGTYYESENFEEAIVKYHIKRKYGTHINVCENALALKKRGELLKCF